MDVHTGSFAAVRGSLDAYATGAERFADAEAWRSDHDAAIRCFDFEMRLAFGLSLFETINRIDEAYRLKVFRGGLPHDPAFDGQVTDLYQRWLAPCDRVLDHLAALEADYRVERADEFRAACREVRGILADQATYFDSDALADLRDRAIDVHRAGKTEVMD